MAASRSTGALRRMLPATALVALAAVLPIPVATATSGTPGVVDVQVTPALARVRLHVGGVEATTDRAGEAHVALDDVADVAGHVWLASPKAGGGTRVRITHVLSAPGTGGVQVGLAVRSPVLLSVDPGTSGVPGFDVRALWLRSLTGQVVRVLPRSRPRVLLTSARSVVRHGALHTQRVTWTVDRVATAGRAVVTTPRSRFDPGRHSVWPVQLAPVQGTVDVRTVPRTAGVQVVVGGQSMTTGPRGRVTVPVADLAAISGRSRLLTPWAAGARVQLLHLAHLPPGRLYHRRLLLALRVSRPVDLAFVDDRGRPIAADRVTMMRLDQGGRRRTIRRPGRAGPVWLPTATARNVHGQWTARQLTYSVRSVIVDGSNAVFSGRQHFTPRPGVRQRITLSVFPLSVTVSDVLFGHRTTSAVQVRLPDGKHLHVTVGKTGSTVIPSLARGLYRVTVDAALIGRSNHILVSQPSQADLRVITRLDAGVVLAGLALIAGGLLLAGRATAARAARRARIRRRPA
jgi:hypothetical protein